MAKERQLSWKSKLVHSAAKAPDGFSSLITPVYRGSTTLFRDAASVGDTWRQDEAAYTYGLYGTPTTLELAARIAELEGATHTFLAPGGQAALALVNLAFLGPGDHVLIPESIYGPHRLVGDGLLRKFGIEVEYYDPLIGEGIAGLLSDNTRVIWCESPGSVTMEVQDLPAIARAATGRDITIAIDNTYSAGVMFDAFSHGAHVTLQALTKYIGGHSDILMGSISVKDEVRYARIGEMHQMLGMAVSPDDCSLVLRGLQTLGVRLERLEASCLTIARWLEQRPEIERVLHPALPASPGHAIWKRDFTGSASVFSIVFKAGYAEKDLLGFIDALTLFKIGYSWGGVTSLAVPYFHVRRQHRAYGSRLVRLNIGLEEVEDLLADLEGALETLPKGL
ncbi:cystathionine beta-lyase [Bosea vestrisii]|uniref:cystathionine beta-lyase n=1 Tax=Bosea vestrisii TaxID=151416 RepID=UPI0024E00846|nr:cystathionine beta-lyase [Bosea vestrisii]WID97959.1 cystathionine beta-lyase [Bosea vestrisii]